MPAVRRALWFEDIGLLNEPIFDTPAGRISFRQFIILGFFTIISYITFIAMPLDNMGRLIAAGGVFIAGLSIAMQRVRTIPPEKYLLLILVPRRKEKIVRKSVGVGVLSPVMEKSVDVIVKNITDIEPLKIIGVLRDADGKPLVNRRFIAYVEGEEIGAGVTDDEGFFMIYFKPKAYGEYRIDLVPEGFSEYVDHVVVSVRS